MHVQNIKFVNTNNTVVNGITSLNSKMFHMAVLHCNNFQARNLKIIAPANSPNTDGIHIERNSGVSITQSHIGTGDDCVSIGQSNSDVFLANIKCGPGHGIRYIITATTSIRTYVRTLYIMHANFKYSK